MSLGETLIEKELKKLNIAYQKQYSLCHRGKTYFFDFFLPDFNTIIEFHGKQHWIRWGKSKKHYSINKHEWRKYQAERQIRTDEIKRNICSLRSLKLVTIPFWKTSDIPHIIWKIYYNPFFKIIFREFEDVDAQKQMKATMRIRKKASFKSNHLGK